MQGEDNEYLGPTEVRLERGDVIREESDRGGIEFRTFSYPLAYYFRHEYITPAQFRAGSRFAYLHRSSVLRHRYVRMNYGEVTDGADIESFPLSIRDYLEAYRAITGEEERKTVCAVCCDDKKAGPRRGMILLRRGLDDLVIHFKKRKKNDTKDSC